MGAIDRTKHDSDVMERVLGAAADSGDALDHSEVIAIGVRPWLGGTVSSAVQLTVRDLPAGRERSRGGNRGAS